MVHAYKDDKSKVRLMQGSCDLINQTITVPANTNVRFNIPPNAAGLPEEITRSMFSGIAGFSGFINKNVLVHSLIPNWQYSDPQDPDVDYYDPIFKGYGVILHNPTNEAIEVKDFTVYFNYWS